MGGAQLASASSVQNLCQLHPRWSSCVFLNFVDDVFPERTQGSFPPGGVAVINHVVSRDRSFSASTAVKAVQMPAFCGSARINHPMARKHSSAASYDTICLPNWQQRQPKAALRPSGTGLSASLPRRFVPGSAVRTWRELLGVIYAPKVATGLSPFGAGTWCLAAISLSSGTISYFPIDAPQN